MRLVPGVYLVLVLLLIWAYREGEIEAKHIAIIAVVLSGFAIVFKMLDIPLGFMYVPATLILCVLIISLFDGGWRFR